MGKAWLCIRMNISFKAEPVKEVIGFLEQNENVNSAFRVNKRENKENKGKKTLTHCVVSGIIGSINMV